MMSKASAPSLRRVLVPEKLAHTLVHEYGIPEAALLPWCGDLPEPELMTHASAAVLWHRDSARLCRHLLQHKARWEWMHSLWTGIEHLPVEDLWPAVKVLTTGKGTGAIPLAEWVLLALLWHAKRVAEHEAAFRQGCWETLELKELHQATVVLLGLGAVGREVARLVSACGARVIGVARTPRKVAACAQVVPLAQLTQVCAQAQALVLVLPATPATTGLVDGQILRALPHGALVVNIGRASVIQEQALLAEVTSGRLWAALDVWWQEPLPPDSPWRAVKNLLPSPHGAYRTQRFTHRHARRVAENLRAYLAGRPLKARVSKKEWQEILGLGGV